jgi:carboxymethylenebutenolidase
MSFKTDWVRYGNDKQHLAFAVWPERATAPLPAVVVIQEAWGVDEHIEDVARRFAQAGYLAFAPDLFSVKGERPSYFTKPRMTALKEFVNTMPPAAWGDTKARDEALSKLPEPKRGEVGESLGQLMGSAMGKMESFVPVLVDAASYLRTEHPLSKGAKIGSVGYCMGGALSVRLACADPKLAAAVIYYGNAPEADRLAKITCPVLGFYGSLDERVNAGIPELVATMKKHDKKFEHHVYDGAQHAFNNDGRPSYNARATRDAFARTLELFRKEL